MKAPNAPEKTDQPKKPPTAGNAPGHDGMHDHHMHVRTTANALHKHDGYGAHRKKKK